MPHRLRVLAGFNGRNVTKGIVHLVSSLQVGGAEKFVYNLAVAQRKRGLDVTVLSFGQDTDPFQIELQRAGVAIMNIRGVLPGRCRQLLQLRRFGLIHIHSPGVIRALLPVCLVLWRKRVVYTIHGEVDPPESLMKFSHQMMALFLGAITAVSAAARQSVRGRYGWQPDKVCVYPNGINLPAISSSPDASGLASRPLRLGVVSRLIPLKNLALIFQALDRLEPAEQAQLELHIFGDGPCREELDALAAARASQHCCFYGNVQSEADIFNAFDLLVMSSNTEGLPMSIIEAMGYGKPVIATDVGAVATLVEEGATGWLYQPGEAAQLAGIFTEILKNRLKVSDYGRAGRQRVAAIYSIDVVADKFSALYRQLGLSGGGHA